MEPEEVARRFCAAFDRKDLATIEAILDEKVVKHTIGTERTVGRQAALAALKSVFDRFERIEFRITNLATSDNTVLTERIDEFTANGVVAPVPVMGTFEVSGGRIVAWRDYCDLTLTKRLMAGEQLDSLLPG
jgi:limonene-1,2-epoxide hydrolase